MRYTLPVMQSRLFLIDDLPVLRHGLCELLTGDLVTLCATAAKQGEVVQALGARRFDLAILGLSLEDNGFELISLLKRKNIRVLIYSMHESAEVVQQALQAGANGYVSKRDAPEVVLTAVKELRAGRTYLSPRLVPYPPALCEAETPPVFSTRELQVMLMLARGCSDKEITAQVQIGPRTKVTVYNRIINKLQLGGVFELRQYLIATQTGVCPDASAIEDLPPFCDPEC